MRHTHILLGIGLSIIAIARPAAATPIVEDFTTTTFRDSVETTADWNTGLGVLRLPPFAPSLRASFVTPGRAFDVAWRDGLAYVADQSAGLQIFDVTDPSSPTLLGGFDTPRFALGVAVSGPYAFIGDSDGGFLVLDVTDPANPAQVGSFDTTGFAADIAVVGDLAFVNDNNDGVQIISIANPSLPSLIANYDPPQGVVQGVAATPNLLYLAEDTAGLRIVDVQDPANPTLLSTLVVNGGATDVEVRDNVAFVTGATAGLLALDVANPFQPQLLDATTTPGSAKALALSGNRALVADGSAGVQSYDISDPSQITYTNGYDTFGDARGIAGVNNMALVAGDTGGLQVVQLEAPSDLGLVGSVATSSNPIISADGNHLVVLANNFFRVYDMSDPGSPVIVASASTSAQRIRIEGDHVYLLSLSPVSRLEIYDWKHQILLGNVGLTTFPSVIDVQGGHAYVGTIDALLNVIDVSDPASPTITAQVPTASGGRAISVAGNRAYVATLVGYEIFDVSDPSTPLLLGGVQRSQELFGGMVAAGDVLYVPDSSELLSYDVSNPATPQLLDILPIPVDPSYSGTRSVLGFDTTLYVLGNYARLFEVDASDPANLRLARQVDTGSEAALSLATGTEAVYLGVIPSDATTEFRGVRVLRRYQAEVERVSAVGQSTTLNDPQRLVAAVGLRSDPGPGVNPEFSVDGGASFTALSPTASSFVPVDSIGSESALVWRLSLGWEPALTPEVSSHELEVLYASATIASVEDIGPDQGGKVSVRFETSGLELPGAPTGIDGYNILRRVDEEALARSAPLDTGATPRTVGGEAAIGMPGTTIRRSASGDIVAADTLPPGSWIVVAFTFAMDLPEYLVEASTVVDGVPTDFIVAAPSSAAGTTFFSPIMAGTSLDNIAPGVPTNLVAAPEAELVSLAWDAAPEPDFQFHRVYRGATVDFTPSTANRIGETADTGFTDGAPSSTEPFYRVTTLDHAGNESVSAVVEAEATTSTPSPRRFVLHGARPNPFNPATTVSFELDREAHVRLFVYDAGGRMVRVLVDRVLTGGRHSLVWDGRDVAQRPVASGVYFLRLQDGDRNATQPIALVR